jgi:hypothetical protein
MGRDEGKCAWIECGERAEWEVWLEGKHKMPVCEEHVRRFQADKGERGETRLGMVAGLGRGRYLIEGIGVGCHQCGKTVEKERECYATPVCYACLPPPEPLPVRAAPNAGAVPRRGSDIGTSPLLAVSGSEDK